MNAAAILGCILVWVLLSFVVGLFLGRLIVVGKGRRTIRELQSNFGKAQS